MPTQTLAMKMTFSEKDYEKAMALLKYTYIDEGRTPPDDDFFTGKNVREINLSQLMAGGEEEAHKMCFAMMLFMAATTELPTKSKWQQRIDEAQKKNKPYDKA